MKEISNKKETKNKRIAEVKGIKQLTKYEKEQILEIKKWKEKKPGVVSKSMGYALKPLTWLVNKIIPVSAIRGALDFSSSIANWLTDKEDILNYGEVFKIEELRSKKLELSDILANKVHNWAISIATGEGALTGFFGLPGMVVDIPTIITFAMRTIYKIGLCYGYESKSELDKMFVYGVMSASAANSMTEKISALTTLKSIEVTIAKVTWKKMAEKAAENQLSKEGIIIAVKNLAKQLGINITKRKALEAIPVVGLAIGGSVNGWYIKEVGWAARRAFQERWLIDNGKI